MVGIYFVLYSCLGNGEERVRREMWLRARTPLKGVIYLKCKDGDRSRLARDGEGVEEWSVQESFQPFLPALGPQHHPVQEREAGPEWGNEVIPYHSVSPGSVQLITHV